MAPTNTSGRPERTPALSDGLRMTKPNKKLLSVLPAMFAAVALFLFISPLFPSFARGIGLDSAWIIGLNQGFADGLVFGVSCCTRKTFVQLLQRTWRPMYSWGTLIDLRQWGQAVATSTLAIFHLLRIL